MFQPVFINVHDKTQGSGCASSIDKHTDDQAYISCHYGSGYDGDRYKFKKGFILLDPICDQCVGNLIKLRLVEKVPGKFLWGLNG